MKVLVAVKKSILDLQGEYVRKQVEAGRIEQSHLTRLQNAHDDNEHACVALFDTLTKYNVEYTTVAQDRYWPNPTDYDAIFAVGGDGTTLEASHHILGDSLPLIGIRSSGMSVGQLCCGGVSRIDATVAKWLQGELKFHSISRLKARVFHVDRELQIDTKPVLNDFLYTNTNPAATTRYKIQYGNICEKHKSSGIWVSTAAGSTAALGAAGGDQLPLTNRNFQFLVRELYEDPGTSCMIRKGYFDFEENVLGIENACHSAMLSLDGQHHSVNLKYGDRIEFVKAANLCLAVSDEKS